MYKLRLYILGDLFLSRALAYRYIYFISLGRTLSSGYIYVVYIYKNDDAALWLVEVIIGL